MTTFLDDLTDLIDPTPGDPLLSSGGKAQTAYQKSTNDAVEDIRLSLVGKPFRSVKAFARIDPAILDSADATTQWVGVSLGASPSLDAAVKTTGSASVKLRLRTSLSASKGYVNIPGAPATAGKVRLVFDFRWLGVGSLGGNLLPSDCFEMFIASAADMGGTVVAFPIPTVTASSFVTLTVPVSGVGNLGSFGFRHKGAGFAIGTTDESDVWIDSVRWEATELDVALDSANAIIIPADYTSAVTQRPIALPATKTIIDLRAASTRVSREDGRRSSHEFGIVPNTAEDMTGPISYAIGQVGTGVFKLEPGQYVFNGQLDLRRVRDFVLEMYGVVLYRTIQNPNYAFINIKSCQRLGILGGAAVGFHTDLTVGSSLVSVASNRLSQQQSSREDATPTAEAILWTQMTGSSLGNNTKIARRPKGQSYEVHPTTAGGTSTLGMKLPTGLSAPIDVEPSTSYTPAAWFRPVDQPATYNPWAARTCEIVVFWWKADGTASTTPSSTVSGVEIDQNTWKLVSGPVTSPADAARASIECHIVGAAGTSGGLSGEAHAIDDIDLHRTTARTLGTAGSTILLAQPGDEVRIPVDRVYGYDKDMQIKVDFVLSDDNHVANDCEIIARDEESGEVLSVTVIPVLTGTPTTVQHLYTGNNYSDMAYDPARTIRFSVRKKTRGTNTITVTSGTEYSRAEYNGATEGGVGIVVSDTDPDSDEITIEDFRGEALGSDAIMFTSGGNRCVGRRVVSRACQRQGLTVAGGTDNGFEDFEVWGSGRSGVDFEPPTAGRVVRLGYLRRGRIYRPTNAGLAFGPWAASEFCEFDHIFIWKAGVANQFGGKWATVSNIKSISPRHSSAGKDMQLSGLQSVFSNIVCEYGYVCDNSARTYMNDGGELIPFNAAGNRVNGIVVRSPSAGVDIQGDNFADPASSRGIETAITPGVSSFTVTIPAQFDTTFGVFLEFNWLTTWRITARTTTSFTVAVGTVVPASPSVHWMTAGP